MQRSGSQVKLTPVTKLRRVKNNSGVFVSKGLLKLANAKEPEAPDWKRILEEPFPSEGRGATPLSPTVQAGYWRPHRLLAGFPRSRKSLELKTRQTVGNQEMQGG